jgi:hypothetical protein
MTDAFALLEEPRRPWIDPDQLKTRFLSLSSPVHPDRVHGESDETKRTVTQRYSDLNAAYQRLKEPKDRLLHLWELETGERTRDIQRIPPGTMDFFAQVGQLCRDVDTFLADRKTATSPLVQVQYFQRGMEWMDRINSLQGELDRRRVELVRELESMNRLWETAPPDLAERRKYLPLERLEQIYRTFSYLSRWTEQLQERVVQLAV